MIVYSTAKNYAKIIRVIIFKSTHRIINSAVIIHIDKFPYLSYVKFKPVENLFFVLLIIELKLGSSNNFFV
jgi:hypothetical protein